MGDDAWLWLGLFILFAYGLEAVTGFGSTVVALSLGALLLPIGPLARHNSAATETANLLASGGIDRTTTQIALTEQIPYRVLPLVTGTAGRKKS